MEDIAEVIVENEKLIYKISSYFPYYQDKDDLYQAGCKGIIEAYNRYDASRDVKFTSYAYSYILGEMKKVVREDKSIKISRDINTYILLLFLFSRKINNTHHKLFMFLIIYICIWKVYWNNIRL